MILEQNERQIQPIQTWVNGNVVTLSVIKIDNYYGYDFIQNAGYAHYCLCEYSETTIQDYDGNDILIANKRSVLDGSIPMTWQLIENWGTDDEPIFQYVLNQLNLTQI